MIYGRILKVCLVMVILIQAGRSCNDNSHQDQPTFREDSFVNNIDPSPHQLADPAAVNPWLSYHYDGQTQGRTLGGINKNQSFPNKLILFNII